MEFLINLLLFFVLLPLGVLSFIDSEDDRESWYLTLLVLTKERNCYFVPVKSGEIFDFEFNVEEVSFRSAAQIKIDASVSSESDGAIKIFTAVDYGRIADRVSKSTTTFKICFNNPYSYSDVRIGVEINVKGIARRNLEKMKARIDSEIKTDKIHKNAERIMIVLRKVDSSLSKCHHKQFLINSMLSRDLNRAKAINGIIDKWSLINVTIITVTGLIQIFALRKLFDDFDVSRGLNVKI